MAAKLSSLTSSQKEFIYHLATKNKLLSCKQLSKEMTLSRGNPSFQTIFRWIYDLKNKLDLTYYPVVNHRLFGLEKVLFILNRRDHFILHLPYLHRIDRLSVPFSKQERFYCVLYVPESHLANLVSELDARHLEYSSLTVIEQEVSKVLPFESNFQDGQVGELSFPSFQSAFTTSQFEATDTKIDVLALSIYFELYGSILNSDQLYSRLKNKLVGSGWEEVLNEPQKTAAQVVTMLRAKISLINEKYLNYLQVNWADDDLSVSLLLDAPLFSERDVERLQRFFLTNAQSFVYKRSLSCSFWEVKILRSKLLDFNSFLQTMPDCALYLLEEGLSSSPSLFRYDLLLDPVDRQWRPFGEVLNLL